jgi:hypothetical protein
VSRAAGCNGVITRQLSYAKGVVSLVVIACEAKLVSVLETLTAKTVSQREVEQRNLGRVLLGHALREDVQLLQDSYTINP